MCMCVCMCVHAFVYVFVCLCLHTPCLHACIVRLFKSGSRKIDLRKVLFCKRGGSERRWFEFILGFTLSFLFLYKNLYLQVTVDDENESVVSQKRSFPRTYARVQLACSYIEYICYEYSQRCLALSRAKTAPPPPSPSHGGRGSPFLAFLDIPDAQLG